MPAFRSALEVLAANQVEVATAKDNEFTPTPVISHAILCYNKGKTEKLSDGIVITPSHNPPDSGGFKYNPPHGGPAEKEITDWIQNQANEILQNKMRGVERISFDNAIKAPTTLHFDFMTPYINDLENVIDTDLIQDSGIKIGVDPLGGAGVHYWSRIAELYKLDLSVLNKVVDPTFKFMTRDWDGQIRMDPSSAYAMHSLVEKGKKFDISFACDTDHDRHGIVSKKSGLIPANHYLAASVFYLFKNRPEWAGDLKVGKTVVSSQMIDRVAKYAERGVYEVPVGFKWFVDGLKNSKLGFAGEESAGSSFLRKDGSVWTTDKDGIIAALLSAEMTASLEKDPAELYGELCEILGQSFYNRVEVAANAEDRKKIGNLKSTDITAKTLAGDPVEKILTETPGNNFAIGGLKVESKEGWIAIRPSGTENIYKIYSESFVSQEHLDLLNKDGEQIVNKALGK